MRGSVNRLSFSAVEKSQERSRDGSAERSGVLGNYVNRRSDREASEGRIPPEEFDSGVGASGTDCLHKLFALVYFVSAVTECGINVFFALISAIESSIEIRSSGSDSGEPARRLRCEVQVLWNCFHSSPKCRSRIPSANITDEGTGSRSAGRRMESETKRRSKRNVALTTALEELCNSYPLFRRRAGLATVAFSLTVYQPLKRSSFGLSRRKSPEGVRR